MNSDLIERLKNEMGWREESAEAIELPVQIVADIIAALTPVTDEEARHRLDYLKEQAEDCDGVDDFGAHAEQLWGCHNLIERLARKNHGLWQTIAGLKLDNDEIPAMQQRIEKLEALTERQVSRTGELTSQVDTLLKGAERAEQQRDEALAVLEEHGHFVSIDRIRAMGEDND